MTEYEDALKCFDDSCMGEHIHEWCNGDGMQQVRSGVYGFEFTVEQIETIRKALKLASVAQEMVTMLDKANRTYLGSEYVVCLNPKDVDEALAKFKEILK